MSENNIPDALEAGGTASTSRSRRIWEIEIDGELIRVTEEVYHAYKRPRWTEHKRDERESRCIDEKGNRCMKPCAKCNKKRTGKPLSLDRLFESGTDIPDGEDAATTTERNLLLAELRGALGELCILDRRIAELFGEGKAEREIAKAVGLSQKGVNKRKAKIFARLKERLANFI
jgi:DNA-binding CsgD family transcriptional regulator